MNKNNFDKSYIKYYPIIRSHFCLRAQEVVLMFYIDNLSRIEGWCYAEKSGLAYVLGVSDPTLYAILKKLKTKGLIDYEKNSNGKTDSNMPRNVSLVRPTQLWISKMKTIEFITKKRNFTKNGAKPEQLSHVENDWKVSVIKDDGSVLYIWHSEAMARNLKIDKEFKNDDKKD